MKRLLLLSALLNFAVANGVFATEVFIHIDPLDFEEDSSKEEESIKDSALDSPKGEESSSDSMLDSSKEEESSSELTHQQSAIQPQASNIFEAVNGGNLDRVKELVKEDRKNIDITDHDGNTPLHIASMRGYPKIIAYLIGEVYCSVDKQNNDRKTALNVAKDDETRKFLQTEISKILQKIQKIHHFTKELEEETEKKFKQRSATFQENDSFSPFEQATPTMTEKELAPIVYIEQMEKCKQKTKELLNVDFEDVYSLKINRNDVMPIQILNLLEKMAIERYKIARYKTPELSYYYNTAKGDCLKKAKELGINLDIEQLEKSPIFAMFTALCVLDHSAYHLGYTNQIRTDIILRCIENSDIFFKYARDLLEKTPMKHDLLLQKALRVLAMIGHKEAIELLGDNSKEVEIVDSFKTGDDIKNIVNENYKIDEKYREIYRKIKGTSYSYDNNLPPEMDKDECNKIKYTFKLKEEWSEKKLTSTVTIPLPVRKTFIGRHNSLAEIWGIQSAKLSPKTYGWKIHISAYPNTAKKVMEIVLQAMKDQDYHYKATSNIEILRGFMLRCIYMGGISQAGKFITIYTESDEEAKNIVNEIEKGFNKAKLHGIKDFPPCVGEFQVGDTGGIFVRWCPDYTGKKESENNIIRSVPLVEPNSDLNNDEKEEIQAQIPEKHPFDQELTYLGMKIDRNHFREYVLPEKIEKLYRYLALDKDFI